MLVAPVEVIKPVYRAFALSGKRRNHEGRGSPEIRRHHGCALKRFHARDDGRMAVDADLRPPQANVFLKKAGAVFIEALPTGTRHVGLHLLQDRCG